MKKILISSLFTLTSFFGFSQDLPKYYIENGDTIGITLSIEQVQKLDNDGDLLILFKTLSTQCDSVDTYYVKVINELGDKVAIIELEKLNLHAQLDKQGKMVSDLKLQVKNREDDIKKSNEQLSNDTLIISDLNKDISQYKKDIRNQKIKSALGFTGTGILGALSLTLLILYIAK